MSNILPDDVLKRVLRISDQQFTSQRDWIRDVARGVIEEYEDKLNARFSYIQLRNITFLHNRDYRVTNEDTDSIGGYVLTWIRFYNELRDMKEGTGLQIDNDDYGNEGTGTDGEFDKNRRYWTRINGGILIHRQSYLASYYNTYEYYRSLRFTTFGYGLTLDNGAIRSDIQNNLALIVAERTGYIRSVFLDMHGQVDMESMKMAIRGAKDNLNRLYESRQL